MSSGERTLRRPWLRVPFLGFGLLQAFTASSVWAIFSGGQILRAFALGSAALALVLPLLISLEAGLTAIMLFEPFRGILRRMQYLIVPYSDVEPIHLLTPFAAFMALLILLNREKLSVLFQTPLAKGVTALAAICFLQIFNPLQGGLFVGLSGALFFLVPMVWFYFGQHSTPEFFPRMMRLIVVVGIVTSLWGVYQTVFGYPEFELYWIHNTDHMESIAVYNVTRALATFSNSEEWGRYTEIGCLIAMGLGLSRTEGKFRFGWFICGGVLFVMLALTGQRSSIFGLFLGLALLFLTGARTLGSGFLRVVLLGVLLAGFLGLSSRIAGDDTYEPDTSNAVNTMLSHTTKGTLDPTNEYSLGARFETWHEIVTERLPSNPLGVGIGDSTLAGARGDENERRPTDNHFLTIAVSAGIPALLLFIWIFWRAFRVTIKIWRNSERDSANFSQMRIAIALLGAFVLGNFFGTSFGIYSIAPIGWLLFGWISARGRDEGV